MKNFKIFKSLLLLSSSLSCLLIGTTVATLAGCENKRATHCNCKFKAPVLIPSTPVPPKPKPKPKKDPFKKELLKHQDWFSPFILEYDKKLFAPKINSKIVRDYLIENLCPNLKYDYSKVNFIGGIETAPKKPTIEWVRIVLNDLTKITALFITTPNHQVGIDFWISAQN